MSTDFQIFSKIRYYLLSTANILRNNTTQYCLLQVHCMTK